MTTVEPAAGLEAIPSLLRWLGAVAFVVAVPLFLVLGNVLEVAADRAFYDAEFVKYDISRMTGLDTAQLGTVADAFIAYLRDPNAKLDVVVTLNGQRRPLFNEKEVRHMEDVQKLFGLVRTARLVAGAILLILPLLGLWLGGAAILPRLGWLLVYGGVATIAFLGLAGLLSLVDFTELFIKFHQVAFSNDDWMLDPRTDYLVVLFPEPFWFDCVVRIATQSILEAIVVGGVGVGMAIFGARR